jgi:hypothetical protein
MAETTVLEQDEKVGKLETELAYTMAEFSQRLNSENPGLDFRVIGDRERWEAAIFGVGIPCYADRIGIMRVDREKKRIGFRLKPNVERKREGNVLRLL